MISEKRRILAVSILILSFSGCKTSGVELLRTRLSETIAASGAEVGFYYRDIDTGDTVSVNPDLRMHAASTMKVPVMIQIYRDFESGRLGLEDFITIENEFHSIIDGSTYSLNIDDDSDSALYDMIGDSIRIKDLVVPMITMSSNLATNILIELVDARRAQQSMRELGADSIAVLRGVEDIKAYRAGLSNTTTARDLGMIFEGLIAGRAASDSSTRAMLEILKQQHFDEGIPTGLPGDAVVAHKTGTITQIRHDAGIVELESGRRYVLVVLTRGIEDGDEADALIAEISGIVYETVYR